jgi:hypothetical protein
MQYAFCFANAVSIGNVSQHLPQMSAVSSLFPSRAILHRNLSVDFYQSRMTNFAQTKHDEQKEKIRNINVETASTTNPKLEAYHNKPWFPAAVA